MTSGLQSIEFHQTMLDTVLCLAAEWLKKQSMSVQLRGLNDCVVWQDDDKEVWWLRIYYYEE